MSGVVTVAAAGDVAVVTLDRPPVNALDAELLEALTATAERLAEERPGAVVLTGAGRCFSAGMDLRSTPALDAAGQRRTVAALDAAFTAWYALPLPVVAAVGGAAIAGGMILALCADRRVAAAGAPLGLAEVRVGIPYPRAALAVVRAELTGPAARRLALGAENVAAESLVDGGAVDEVVPAAEVGERALAAARDLAALDARAYADTKLRLRAPALAECDGPDPLADGWLTVAGG
ncbi:enoyl-CoA hydratase-related protein [Conexibacter arvalis]|uniref:Enoyl-CoA hydratase n=1 Tax=Conexibacter arvalis TaxID=912552 RepID=A0A840I8W4_9ACTN|nr:enoyl-CoA hydratase [Conexibacter arvalis]